MRAEDDQEDLLAEGIDHTSRAICLVQLAGLILAVIAGVILIFKFLAT